MARKKPKEPQSFRFGSEKLDEVAAVLEVNQEATDTEVCEAVNRWWSNYGANTADDPPLTVADVARIRQELGIPETRRKPFQKMLFEP